MGGLCQPPCPRPSQLLPGMGRSGRRPGGGSGAQLGGRVGCGSPEKQQDQRPEASGLLLGRAALSVRGPRASSSDVGSEVRRPILAPGRAKNTSARAARAPPPAGGRGGRPALATASPSQGPARPHRLAGPPSPTPVPGRSAPTAHATVLGPLRREGWVREGRGRAPMSPWHPDVTQEEGGTGPGMGSRSPPRSRDEGGPHSQAGREHHAIRLA